MSFITPENQTRLWKIITNTELFQSRFQNKPQTESFNWFKKGIEYIYNTNGIDRQLTNSDLMALNKEAIRIMVADLKTVQQHISAGMNNSIYGEPTTAYSRNYGENKQDIVNREFAERQKEYNTLLEKPLPKEVNFKENATDEAISNMDELIKQHISQRELELRQYAPPPPLVIDNSTNVSPASLNENIKYEIISPSPRMAHQNPALKKVSWQDDSIIEKLNKLTDEIDFIKQFLQKKWGEYEKIGPSPLFNVEPELNNHDNTNDDIGSNDESNK
jgi:hypothetical protein